MTRALFLLSIEALLAAALLCLAWRRGNAHPRAAIAGAALVPPLLVAALCFLLAFERLLLPLERTLLSFLAGLTALLWIFGLLVIKDEDGAERRVALSPGWTGAWWITLSLLLLGAFILTSTWIAVSDFIETSPQMAAAWRWLWVTLLCALAAGAALTAVALAGVLSQRAPEGPEPLPRLIGCLIGAVALRGLSLAASLAVWAHYCPFGASHFFYRLAALEYANTISLRILLGMLLPLLFGLLAVFALQGGSRRQAAGQFLPVLILVLISEMVAAGLTAGLGGLAF